MGVAMITEEQAKKIKELSVKLVIATTLLATGPNGSAVLRKLAQFNAEKELDNYLKEITSE